MHVNDRQEKRIKVLNAVSIFASLVSLAISIIVITLRLL